MFCESRMDPRHAVVKNGDTARTSSWAANNRPSVPTVKVTIREVRELVQAPVSYYPQARKIPKSGKAPAHAYLETGELSNDFFNFANFASRSREDFFNFVAFSTRSLVRNERLNMAAVSG